MLSDNRELLMRVVHRQEVAVAQVLSANVLKKQTQARAHTLTHTTVVHLSVHPMARKRMHALKGLACRKHVAAASSPADNCATRLRLRQAFSRTLRLQKP
jgi:hypothetical protein